MHLMVNGQEKELAAGSTVADLVADCGFRPGSVVVERNEEIVSGEAWRDVQLATDDVIEIVQFMGGGC
ncbi:MAG TPA: thiamine biosynthesis protein ThiS [Selenomonas sp.]|jgi:thiamine biosynthesis protein ThiS|nr:sulfur carrier protein ThiS [Selenomonadaceae bacterium]MDD6120800.1 sulfur carrier protein ThiS [Selenomonadaceae bacterium]MDD7056549.1 sulfur carrier protein ThiS [Selenomonadaceae bacterium]MDY3916023.1 sulfur carrier protein ThiS [Selenomonadaceae bacterium]HBT80260.1 thiamine biosynthesis protein ThiS [Selenomonas sp.]